MSDLVHERAKIVESRGVILSKMVDWFKGRAGVIGLFISGSLAAETADAWSDIDFRVVVDDAHYADFIDQKTRWTNRWGDVLFHEPQSFANCCVTHYRSFVKVDVFYYRPGDLVASPWHIEPIQIISDPQRMIQRTIDESRTTDWSPSIDAISAVVDKAISFAFECKRKWLRGDWLSMQDMLHGFRLQLVVLDDLLHARLPKGFSRASERVTPALITAIEQSYTDLDAGHLRRAFEILMRAFRELLDLAPHGESIGLNAAEILRMVER